MSLRLIDLSDLAPSAPSVLGKCAAKFIASPLRFTRAVPGVCNDEGINGTLRVTIWSISVKIS